MLIGAAALDRGQPLLLRYCLTAFGARPGAVAAIVIGALAVFAAEAFAAYFLAGANLLAPDPDGGDLSSLAVIGTIVTGALASLPVVFVRLLRRCSPTRPSPTHLEAACVPSRSTSRLYSFRCDCRGAGRAGSVVGCRADRRVSLLSAASYAAWKDVFIVDAGRAAASSG